MHGLVHGVDELDRGMVVEADELRMGCDVMVVMDGGME